MAVFGHLMSTFGIRSPSKVRRIINCTSTRYQACFEDSESPPFASWDLNGAELSMIHLGSNSIHSPHTLPLRGLTKQEPRVLLPSPTDPNSQIAVLRTSRRDLFHSMRTSPRGHLGWQTGVHFPAVRANQPARPYVRTPLRRRARAHEWAPKRSGLQSHITARYLHTKVLKAYTISHRMNPAGPP